MIISMNSLPWCIPCTNILSIFHFSVASFDSGKYHKFLTWGSYGLPLIWTFITMIVEYSAPTCAPYRPKFGFKTENGHANTCFFTGMSSMEMDS